MKCPFKTPSKPVVGSQSKKLIKIIESGGSFTNEKSLKTVERIIRKRKNP